MPESTQPTRCPWTLALYAPLRNDDTLSRYNTLQPPSAAIEDHELLRSLRGVSAQGVHVVALIDRLFEPHSWLVQIPAGRPYDVQIDALGQPVHMDAPQALADLLRRAFAVDPKAEVVLCMEGHGAGYLPKLNPIGLLEEDLADLDPLSPGGVVRWQPPNVAIGDEDRPILPSGYPPTGGPPAWQNNLGLLSTWDIGEALRLAVATREACGRKVALIHFDNCFNMSVEMMSTVAPHAHYATGYMNYNFFTGGASYADVFARLNAQANAGAAELAVLFAQGNQTELNKLAGHPTTGSAVALKRLPGIVQSIYCLAAALTQDAQTAAGRGHIQKSITAAVQYDTGSGFDLEVPDQLTDLRSLAQEICRLKSLSTQTLAAAQDLFQALDGIKVYGDQGGPLFLQGQEPPVRWDFEGALAMSIFCPDPAREGLWDPRSPYYLLPPIAALPDVIDFLRPQGEWPNPWQEFIVEYHRGAAFKGYAYPRIVTPVLGAKPKRCKPCD
jgi:Clostripain family